MGLFSRKRKAKTARGRKSEPDLLTRVRAGRTGSAPGKKLKAPRPKRTRRKPLIFRLIAWGMTLGVWGVIVIAAATAYVFINLDQKGVFNIPAREPGMMLLAADGSVVAERGSFFGDEARVAELPSYLPQAVIAIEDRRFYDHFGIDIQGLIRAAVANYRAGKVVQGGSTITQQLAKNLFLKPERTLERKFQEAVLSLWLESKYTKDEILQLYLNRVYFGAGAVGVEKAAQVFFGKSARDVNLGEAAILAAVLKAPSRLNPLRHPDRAGARANEVIKDMIEAGFITADEAADSRDATKSVRAADYIPATQFIVDWVGEQLTDLIGEFTESIVIETTLDRSMQERAESTVRRRLSKQGAKLKVSQAAVVVLDPLGAVKALVGGKSYIKSQFNRAVHAKRQPGSAFKPFVYLTAIEQGMSPESIEVDEPVRIGDWSPSNYSHKYRGPVTLRTALALSLNSVAVKLGATAGPENVVTMAHRMGINSELQPNASIALGTSEVTLLELTAAYAPFANGGNAAPPHIVTRISTRDGKVLYERSGTGLGQVITAYDVGAMNDMLRAVVTSGTGRRARIANQDIAGKTGTSQDYRDGWFIGFSSYFVAGVWVGNDDNSSTRRVTGGSFPAMIWQDIMGPAHASLSPVSLPGDQRDDEDYLAFSGRSFVEILQGMFGNRVSTESDGIETEWQIQQREQRRLSNQRRRANNIKRQRNLQDSR